MFGRWQLLLRLGRAGARTDGETNCGEKARTPSFLWSLPFCRVGSRITKRRADKIYYGDAEGQVSDARDVEPYTRGQRETGGEGRQGQLLGLLGREAAIK